MSEKKVSKMEEILRKELVGHNLSLNMQKLGENNSGLTVPHDPQVRVYSIKPD